MVSIARDIVETDFISLSKDASCLEAARAMKSKRHGYVIIVSPKGVPEGIATEWDFMAKIVAEAKEASAMPLEAIMSRELVSVDAKTGLDQVAQLMARKGIRRVLVMEGDKILGVVTAAIILRR